VVEGPYLKPVTELDQAPGESQEADDEPDVEDVQHARPSRDETVR